MDVAPRLRAAGAGDIRASPARELWPAPGSAGQSRSGREARARASRRSGAAQQPKHGRRVRSAIELRVFHRHRRVGEEAAALERAAGRAGERVPGDDAVDERELRGMSTVRADGAVEDPAALNNGVRPRPGHRVVGDRRVPERQRAGVRDRAAEARRRSGGSSRP